MGSDSIGSQRKKLGEQGMKWPCFLISSVSFRPAPLQGLVKSDRVLQVKICADGLSHFNGAG